MTALLVRAWKNWLTHGGAVEGEKKWWKTCEEPREFCTVLPAQLKTSSYQRTVHFIDLTRLPITPAQHDEGDTCLKPSSRALCAEHDVALALL